jgi:S-formylglutathione hydrolase FrmB
MALVELLYRSPSLGKQAAAMAIVPQGVPGPYRVWVVLHGMGDDHSAWTRHTRLESYVEGLPILVLMPNGGRGWYTDMRGNPQGGYESMIMRDLLPWVDETFRTIRRRDARIVSGLSMGGYGAMKLALKYPEVFCGVATHSGSLLRFRSDVTGTDPWSTERRLILGRRPRGGPDDLYRLAREIRSGQVPAIRFDCGRHDPALRENREFHAHLNGLRIPHEYHEGEGTHTWPYWDRQARLMIPWVRRVLGLGRSRSTGDVV